MPNASGKLRAMFAAIVDGFVELSSCEGDDAGGGEHHRDGHRLAERAAEAEHGGGDDAGAAEREHRHADHLPAGGAERERGLLVQHRASAGRPRGRSR